MTDQAIQLGKLPKQAQSSHSLPTQVPLACIWIMLGTTRPTTGPTRVVPPELTSRPQLRPSVAPMPTPRHVLLCMLSPLTLPLPSQPQGPSSDGGFLLQINPVIYWAPALCQPRAGFFTYIVEFQGTQETCEINMRLKLDITCYMSTQTPFPKTYQNQ